MRIENNHSQAITGRAAGLACRTPSLTAFAGRRFFRKGMKFVLSFCIALALLYSAPPAGASLITLSANYSSCGDPPQFCTANPNGFNPLPDSFATANLMSDISTSYGSSIAAAAAYINTTFVGNEPMLSVTTATEIYNNSLPPGNVTSRNGSNAAAAIDSVPYRLLALSQLPLPPFLSGIRVPVEFRVRTGWTLDTTNEAPAGVRQPEAGASVYGEYTIKSSLGALETDLFLSTFSILDDQAGYAGTYTLNMIDEGIETSSSETSLSALGPSTATITLLLQPHEQIELSMVARSRSVAECTLAIFDLSPWNPEIPNCTTAESQILLDPYIYVDPASPFAPYYAMQYNLDGQWLTTTPSFPAWSGEDSSVFPASGWLSQPVPEPATLAIFALGLAGLGFFGWRRNRFTASA